ncbi:hypothetical protein [Neisseria iguanae]|uniref:hypothetical protein n=1 Tax=Neisseria iguanae TaxID=90242 RepID=UPI0014744DA6|nr:hypothetical protein [Neisseria iguanae]
MQLEQETRESRSSLLLKMFDDFIEQQEYSKWAKAKSKQELMIWKMAGLCRMKKA